MHRNIIIHRPIRFLVSGGTAAVVEMLAFAAIVFVVPQFSIVFAQSVSFLLGLIVSFILNRKWVFRSTGSQRSEFLKYILLAIINLVLSNYILAMLVGAGIQKLLAKLIIMTLIAAWNYVLFRRVIFRSQSFRETNR